MSGYITIPVRGAAARWATGALGVVAALVAIVVCVEWAIAETVVYRSRRLSIPLVVLDMVYRFEPENPDVLYLVGTYQMDDAQPPDMETAGRLLDRAAALAPNRSKVWLAIARHREQTGLIAEAEQACHRAAALAPYHWRPVFALANVYVRQGRTDEALPLLRRAVELNPELAQIAARTVWGATDGDVDAVSRVIGGTPDGQLALVAIMFGEKRLDDALALWLRAADGRATDPAVADQGRKLAEAFLATGRTDGFMAVWGALDAAHAPTLDALSNSGFEDPPATQQQPSPFGWTLTQASDARVSMGEGRDGGRSLRVDYNAQGGVNFTHATQYVKVRPGARLTLTFWAATDGLQTGGAPVVTIGDATKSGDPIASRPLPSGTTGWTEYRVDLTGPASGMAVVRVARVTCGEVCPIFGTLRIDDMRIGG